MDNAACNNPSACLFVIITIKDLDPQASEGLETAFETPKAVFNMDACTAMHIIKCRVRFSISKWLLEWRNYSLRECICAISKYVFLVIKVLMWICCKAAVANTS